MPFITIMTPAKTVSRASPAFSAGSCEHDRDDQCHLDHGHGDSQDERAERFASPVCDNLGVVDCRKHGGDEYGSCRRGHRAADPQ